MVEKLSINVFLGTIFIYQHILAILPKELEVVACESNPVAVSEEQNLPFNAVLTYENTVKVTKILFTRLGRHWKERKTFRYRLSHRNNSAWTTIYDHTCGHDEDIGLLHFDSNYERTTQGCLPARNALEAAPNRPFYILFIITLQRPLKLDKHKVLACRNDDIYKISNTEWKTSKDELRVMTVICAVVFKKESKRQATDQKIGIGEDPYLYHTNMQITLTNLWTPSNNSWVFGMDISDVYPLLNTEST